jgi:hypothetical protein
MRDKLGRWTLGLLGSAAVVLGTLALLGFHPGATTVLVAVGAVCNGVVVIRLAMGGQRLA